VVVASALGKARMVGVVVMMRAVQQGGAFIVWRSAVCKRSSNRAKLAYIVPACAENGGSRADEVEDAEWP
jgi:hypothetical protein